MELPSQRIECDVMVIGGSTAALVAALEARKSVERVVVVCKRRAGRSGNTIVSGAAFSAAVPGDDEDSPERHLRDTLAGGGGVNDPVLARMLAYEAPAAVMALEEYGVKFLRSNGALVRRTPPGHSRPRSIPTDPANTTHETRGLTINLPLLESALARGIDVLSNQPVHHLLVRDGIARGALVIDSKTGEEVAVIAGAVVLAAGGGGHIFANTNNTADVTGDSYALALEAGVPLRDMEFIQFYPCMMATPVHGTVSSPVFGEGAVLRNVNGERFLQRYDPVNGDMATRDVMSQAIFHEVQAGRGVQGGVYIDLSALSAETMQRKFPSLDKVLRTHGIDHKKQYLVISPATHFFHGGAWIDTRCRTGIEGLYAAGEAAGGVNGANRLSGNALSETVVFGGIAGREAASYVRSAGRLPEPPKSRPELPTWRAGSLSLSEVKAEVRRAMWDNSGIVRTGEGLNRAQATLRECLQELPKCSVETARDVAAYLEIERMARVGLAVTTGALLRMESRGSHYRSDCPERDDERWLGSSRIERDGDGLKVGFVPLVM